ncbi:C39 family peptidase [Streptomyces sp. NBC_00237]|uniref:papain-like cysteine protease family protein n=1 Tax=Streptomyces sp. NBC_00237 TaxID=2975687 RepID=UPI00224EE490|nr:papain-like cysteine protease family protein [Streptomyces sp. NBC_00237]MCX5205614.1 C39 family peptidase [Streptomyces sp. NBC_00237]
MRIPSLPTAPKSPQRGTPLGATWHRRVGVALTAALLASTATTAAAASSAVDSADTKSARVSATTDPPVIHHSQVWTDAPAADRATSRVLRIDQQPQEDPSWDWAAAASTIAGYYGKPVSQSELCHRVAGTKNSSGTCRIQSGDIRDVQQALEAAGIKGSRPVTKDLTYDRLRKEIDAGRPVVGHLEIPGSSLSHTVVAHGYDAAKKWVYWTDSWPTASRYNWGDFHTVLSNTEFKLTAALIGIGPGRSAGDQPTLAAKRAAAPAGSGGGYTLDSARQSSKTAKLLPIAMRKQENDEWCWAASGSTLAAFWGKKFTQTQFCNMGHGRSRDSFFIDWPCANEPGNLNREQSGLKTAGLNPGTQYKSPLTFEEVKEEIDAGRPIYTGIKWAKGGGHAHLIFGYDEATKSLYWGDPWPSANRYNWAPADYYTKNDSYFWNHGVKGVSTPPKKS